VRRGDGARHGPLVRCRAAVEKQILAHGPQRMQAG
jgi:hypothetical protein